MARRSTLPIVRERTAPRYVRLFVPALDRSFASLVPFVESTVSSLALEGTKAEPDTRRRVELRLARLRWDAVARRLFVSLLPFYHALGSEVYSAVEGELGSSVAYNLNAREVRAIIADVARRITRVTDTSRERIARLVAEGIDRGLSVEQIVRGEGAFPGIRGLVDSWRSTGSPGVLRAGGSISSRSYLIAQTETANAFNRASIAAYQTSGLVSFVEIFDGPDCGWTSHDDPDLAHGSIRSLRAAEQYPIAHPRCQRAMGARIGATSESSSPYGAGRPDRVPGATPGVPAR